MGSANGHREDGEPAPTEETVRVATNLIAEIPFRILGYPDISSFYGEIHISWTRGPRQVALMCFPSRTPLVHYYHRMPGLPSAHDIEEASADSLVRWLRWLHD